MRIISRAEWGARAPESATRTTWSKRIGFAVHYSDGSPNTTPKGLQNYAMDTLGYVDTHYNFFVNRDGQIYEGRGWLVVAAHAKDQNTAWIGACFIGRDGDITEKAKASMRWLYEEGNRLKGSKLQISGHGQLPGQNTDCPGNNWKSWIAAGMPVRDGNMAEITMKDLFDKASNTHAGMFYGGSSCGRKTPAGNNSLLAKVDHMWGILDELKASIEELKSRPTADVDEVELAAELERLGVGGPTAAEIINLFASKLGKVS